MPNFAVNPFLDKIVLKHLLIFLHAVLALALALDQILLELELVDQHPHGPQICALVEGSAHDFWSHVLQGAEKGGDALFEVIFHQNFGEPVVCKFDVPLFSQQDVLGLELAIDNAMRVQKANGHNDFSQHVPDHRFGEEQFLFFGVEVEIAFGQILHDDVYILFVLEQLNDVREEGVPADGRNEFALQQVHLVDLRFGNDLHGETLAACFLLRQHHHPVRPLPQAPHALVLLWPPPFPLFLHALNVPAGRRRLALLFWPHWLYRNYAFAGLCNWVVPFYRNAVRRVGVVVAAREVVAHLI